jgi:hypothetical protein
LLVSRTSSRMCAPTLARQSQWRLALHVLYNWTLTFWSVIQGPGWSFVSRCLLGKWRAIFFPAGSSFDKVLTAQLTAAAGPVGPRGLRAAPAGDAIPKGAAVRDRESAVGASGVHMTSFI